ncbi:MAG TPA: host attachment protein [Solirubrobacteraceae bacterium]|jgi:peptide subunit release factor 1 (eRF1)
MLVNDVDAGRLRRLAALKPQGARVLSLYLDLEPTEFATAPARETELTSALDAAARMADEANLEHDARVAIREDIERARTALLDDGLDAKGARAVAIFVCGPADLFEIVKLPQPVATHVTIDDSPWIEPLVRLGVEPHVAVALIDRHNLRLFHGTAASLEELNPDARELREPGDAGHVHERRHRTATEDEADAHFAQAGHALLALLKTRGYDLLVLDARHEHRGAVLERLHPYVRDRIAGEIDVDISSATVDAVRRAAGEVLAEVQARKVREALERLREGLGRGVRAAAGLSDVLSALNERRVEVLLYERGRALAGVVCPADGWLGVGVDECPVDGTPVDRRPNILENAAEAALLQDAEVLVVDPAEHPVLGPHGGIAAVLRF